MSGNVEMRVRDAMSSDVLAVAPHTSLHEAARLMTERKVGSALVVDPTSVWPAILTERDLLHAVAEGKDTKLERVADHQTTKVVFAAADWPLHRAAQTMVKEGFRHLVVVEERRPVGMLSMRDIIRCWVQEGGPPGLGVAQLERA